MGYAVLHCFPVMVQAAVVVVVVYFINVVLALDDMPAFASPEWYPMSKIYASFTIPAKCPIHHWKEDVV